MQYVVEGSVRKAGSRVRMTGQLIDAATAATSGPSASIGNSPISSPCRTNSRSRSLPRSKLS